MSNKLEKAWMDAVAKLPCATCGVYGVHVHHIRTGQGKSQRASDFLVLPLCPSCHQGPNGIHGDKAMRKIMKTDELCLLADTIEAVFMETRRG